MPKCIKCEIAQKAPKQPGQDQSTFICAACQDKLNAKAWKKERDILKKKKDKRSQRETDRLKRVETIIARVKG